MLAATSVLSTVVASFITYRNHERRIVVGALITGGGAFWLMVSALQLTTDSLSTKLFLYRISFVGILIIPTGWFVLAMLLSGYERWAKGYRLVALGVVPFLTLLLVFTNEYHSLMWSSAVLDPIDPFLPLKVTYGFGEYLLDQAYGYGIILVGLIVFARRIAVSRRFYRVQALYVILVAAVPWIVSLAYTYSPAPFPYFDPASLTVTVAGPILLWRLVYLPGADVVPVAHEIIVDNMNDAIIVLDTRRRILDLNPAAQGLIGHTLSQSVGQSIEKVWAGWPDLSKEIDFEAETRKEVTLGNRREGRIYELRSSAIEGLVSNVPNRLITLHDITERKMIEDRLRLYSEHLEELIVERTKELREAERMATIGETAAMVGHDLRNPLTGITGAAYYLRTKEHSKLSEKGKEMLQLIEEDIQRADKILIDLLEYSKEPRLELADTDVKSITGEALALMKIPMNIRVVDSTKNRPKIIADTEKMRRVFVNLIGNALDAMPEGGTLTISSSESDGNIEITFTDTGVGMARETIEKIWSPLFTTKARGIGLGLSIAKRLAEAHGGSINVASKPRRGSAFTVTLPIKPRLEAVGQNAMTEQEGIVVISDDGSTPSPSNSATPSQFPRVQGKAFRWIAVRILPRQF